MTVNAADRSAPPVTGTPTPGAVRLLAAAMFAAALSVVFATRADYGVASDVPNYFFSSVRQLAWLKDFTRSLFDGSPSDVLNRETVLEHWRWMPFRIPHPPLSREIGGLSWLMFRDLFDTLTAYRIGVMVAYGALAASCAAFTAISAASILAGIGAGLGILTIPVLFAHGHLADTDLFLTTFWFGAAALMYLWVAGGRNKYVFYSGLLLGAALATKFTGLLAVPALCAWTILKRPRGAVPALAILGLMTAFVFVVTNPVLWVDPALALSDYLGAGLARSGDVRSMIRTEYFGTFYVYRGPWHYPFVWTLIVLPPTILISIVAALFDKQRRSLVGFSFLSITPLYAALMLPSAPMHDGPRLFLPVFAFLAVLSGVGFSYLVQSAQRLRFLKPVASARVLSALVGFLLFVPAAGAVVRTHPYQLSYFNTLIGGIRGADARGLEVTNMKEVLNGEALRDLAASIPRDATIDAGFFLEELCFYQFAGMAPRGWSAETVWLNSNRTEVGPILVCRNHPTPEIVAVDRRPSDADFLLVLNRKAMWRPVDWEVYEEQERPFYRISLDGVPLLSVYRLK